MAAIENAHTAHVNYMNDHVNYMSFLQKVPCFITRLQNIAAWKLDKLLQVKVDDIVLRRIIAVSLSVRQPVCSFFRLCINFATGSDLLVTWQVAVEEHEMLNLSKGIV